MMMNTEFVSPVQAERLTMTQQVIDVWRSHDMEKRET